jgi:hypothetical protein
MKTKRLVPNTLYKTPLYSDSSGIYLGTRTLKRKTRHLIVFETPDKLIPVTFNNYEFDGSKLILNKHLGFPHLSRTEGDYVSELLKGKLGGK